MDEPDYLGMIEARVQEEAGDCALPPAAATSGEALRADEAWLRERTRVHRLGRSIVIPSPTPMCWS